MQTSDFDYDLPEELIAQAPAERREDSRLLVVERSTERIAHDRFSGIVRYLSPGDVLVANRSRVIPARLDTIRPSGAPAEVLLLRRLESGRWTALARPSRSLRPGMILRVRESRLTLRLGDYSGNGEWIVQLDGADEPESELRRAGSVPFPPYIRNRDVPPERYQTVYADVEGSVAAPTAGLHFSERLLDDVQAAGVDVQFVTLHVGPGTFRPVTAQDTRHHQMHAEYGEVPDDVAVAINAARRAGGRVVAVGTTTTRLLETTVEDGLVRPFRGETDVFIYPGYRFGAIDALVTNFHLPRSTLLMLVSAFAGRELVLRAYRQAVAQRYRFFSFGDAMLIV